MRSRVWQGSVCHNLFINDDQWMLSWLAKSEAPVCILCLICARAPCLSHGGWSRSISYVHGMPAVLSGPWLHVHHSAVKLWAKQRLIRQLRQLAVGIMWVKGVSESSRCCSVGPNGAIIALECYDNYSSRFHLVMSNWLSRINTVEKENVRKRLLYLSLKLILLFFLDKDHTVMFI